MYSLILSLVLSSQNIFAEKLNVEVDGKDCVIKIIQYNDIDNLVWAIGNCQILYDMCNNDFCKVQRLEQKELIFNPKNVGKK